MNLSFLRVIDQWIGNFLLYALALPARLFTLFVPAPDEARPRFVFLKLKGGGSLIIAMPALLGLRRKFPQAEFILVCANEAKIYAELTGIFDQTLLIEDSSFFALVKTGLRALRACFQAGLCIDLEPNSMLAAVFTLLTCAHRRIGLVKPEQAARNFAYTDAIAFNSVAPIYAYYDRICEMLGGVPAAASECRAAMRDLLPQIAFTKSAIKTIALAGFTSDFARERMMPGRTWARLLQRAHQNTPVHLLILGSARNKPIAQQLQDILQNSLPLVQITNLAGSGSLAEAVAQLTACDEVWAVDSGLLHISRLLGVTTHSFWGPTMPAQRLRPIDGLSETVHYRPFLCSPCIQASIVPPCGGNNLCMISMAEENPDLRPAWVKKS